MSDSKIIHLLSNPRNISTALMYSFAQRPDTGVIDEPFYAYYLSLVPVLHPGREEVLASQPHTLLEIFDAIRTEATTHPVVFLKNMAHHLIQMDWGFMLPFSNILFIRDPKQIIASFSKVLEKPTMNDIGLEQQSRLFHFLNERLGHPPLVLEAGELLKNPEKILSDLCAALEIPFEEKMLRWEAGGRKEDGVWAKYWYKNVHASTGFGQPPSGEIVLSEHGAELYEAALPHYQFLFDYALKA